MGVNYGNQGRQADLDERGTKFVMAVEIVDDSGNQITTFGSGTQYADGDARGTASGTLLMVDDGTNIQSVAGTTGGLLKVDLSGTAVNTTALSVTAAQATATSLKVQIFGDDVTQAIDVDSSGQLQVDVLTMPTTTVAQATPTSLKVQIFGDDVTQALDVDSSGQLQVDVLTMPTVTVAQATASALNATIVGTGTLAVQAAITAAASSIAAGAIAPGATSIAANEDDASGNLDTGVKILAVQKATPADTAASDGDYMMPQMSAGRLWTSTNLPSGAVASGAIASGAVASGAYASGAIGSGAIASGAVASGAVASGAIASGAIASGALAAGSISAGAFATGATSIADNEDSPSASLDTGVKILAIQQSTPADTAGSNGDYAMLQMSAGRVWVDPSGVTLTVGSHAVTQATASSLNAQVVGNVGSAATDSGNPVKIGGVYNATTPAFTDLQRGDLQITSAGRLKIDTEADTRDQDGYTAIRVNDVPARRSNEIQELYVFMSMNEAISNTERYNASRDFVEVR